MRDHAAAQRRYYANNEEYRQRSRETSAERQRRYYANRKTAVFDYYGRVCRCCGYDDERFLTIDHVNGDGAQRRAALLGKSAIDEAHLVFRLTGAWSDDFQTLCFNCNCAKGNRPWCPHQDPEPST